MRVIIEAFGEKQISRELIRFGARAIDMRPALMGVSERMEQDEEELFESEGSTGAHGKWTPIKEETLQAKINAGYDPRILHRTLAGRESLAGGAGQIKIITRDRLQFGTRVPYMIFHYKGTRTLPIRRPIDFTEAQKRGYIKELQAYMVGESRV